MQPMTMDEAKAIAARFAKRTNETQYIVRITNPKGSYINVVRFVTAAMDVLEAVEPAKKEA